MQIQKRKFKNFEKIENLSTPEEEDGVAFQEKYPSSYVCTSRKGLILNSIPTTICHYNVMCGNTICFVIIIDWGLFTLRNNECEKWCDSIHLVSVGHVSVEKKRTIWMLRPKSVVVVYYDTLCFNYLGSTEQPVLKTRMHSSRMCTIRCSGCQIGGCLPRGFCLGPHLLRGCLPSGVSARGCLPKGCTPPPCGQRHLWQHNLSATTVADGKNPVFDGTSSTSTMDVSISQQDRKLIFI